MKKKIWKRLMQVLGFLIICVMALLSYKANQSKTRVFKSTIKDGTLGKCGKKPNCVSSFQQSSDTHFISSMKNFTGTLDTVDSYFSSCEQIKKTHVYRHFTCKTRFFKFIDDVEILYMPEQKILHFRSGSRVGHSDLGANANRINELKNFLIPIK